MSEYKANYKVIFNDHTNNEKETVLTFKGFNTKKLNIVIDMLVDKGRTTREEFRTGSLKVEKF